MTVYDNLQSMGWYMHDADKFKAELFLVDTKEQDYRLNGPDKSAGFMKRAGFVVKRSIKNAFNGAIQSVQRLAHWVWSFEAVQTLFYIGGIFGSLALLVESVVCGLAYVVMSLSLILMSFARTSSILDILIIAISIPIMFASFIVWALALAIAPLLIAYFIIAVLARVLSYGIVSGVIKLKNAVSKK